MTQRHRVRESFAYVYDTLYGAQTAFLRAQLDFLTGIFGRPSSQLLDIGCGTGIHIQALSELGYEVTGVDIDPLMLLTARHKLPAGRLVLADVRRLPFRRAFAGALCLESPLAYLLDASSLRRALFSITEALADGGQVVIDVFDYPGTLGIRPTRPVQSQFEQSGRRVSVRESHHFDGKTRIWTMRQEFKLEEDGQTTSFEVVHRLAIRAMDEYAQALETAGFTITTALSAYPNMPKALGDERRIILVARRQVA